MSIVISLMFIIAPFLCIPLIILGLIRDRKHSIIYIVLLSLLMALIAYNFNPETTQDLYRYNYIMDREYSTLNLGQYMQIMFNNNKFLFEFLKYIVSQIGNLRILPFVCVFIGYFIVIYTIFDYARIKNIKTYKGIFILLIFLCIFYFINFISGLAQFLATSIGFLAFYLEFVKGKTKIYYKILYVLPGFIHASMFLIILIRILLIFDLRKAKYFIIPLFVFYGVAKNVIYNIVVLFENVPLINVLVSKANMYLLESQSTWYSTYGITIILLLLFFIVVYLLTNKKYREIENEKFCDLIFIVLLFNICSIQYFVIYTRILDLSIILMNLYLLQVLDMVKRKHKIIIIIGLVLFSLALGSVNLNLIQANDFNNIFSNMNENIFYFFRN